MKTIYQAILNQLQAQVPSLKWIDLDKGQMRFEKPPIVFPAALIGLQVARAENLNQTKQLVNAQITIKLCFDFTGNTDASTPEEHRLNSLAYFDLVETVFNKLQGWATAEMNPLERSNQFDEQRPDAYKVTTITFSTNYYEQAITV